MERSARRVLYALKKEEKWSIADGLRKGVQQGSAAAALLKGKEIFRVDESLPSEIEEINPRNTFRTPPDSSLGIADGQFSLPVLSSNWQNLSQASTQGFSSHWQTAGQITQPFSREWQPSSPVSNQHQSGAAFGIQGSNPLQR